MITELKKLKEKRDLKITDRVLLSLIKESELLNGGFDMKDAEIMELLNLSKGALHNSLNKLKALGLIYNYSFDGTSRVIKLMKDVSNGRKYE